MTANPTGPATAAPAQARAAYEAWRKTFGSDAPWSDIGDQEQQAWEAAAQAAIATATVAALRACAENALSEADMTELRDRLAEVVLTPKPALLRPASELGTAWRLLDEARAERDRLREQLEGLRGHIDSLALGLDMAARSTAPSKKSEIESGCASALRGLLRIDGESGEETRRRLDRERGASAGAAGQDSTPRQHPERT